MHEILDEPDNIVLEKAKPVVSKIVALMIIHSFFTLVIARCFISGMWFHGGYNDFTSFLIFFIPENWLMAHLLISLGFMKDYSLSRSLLTSVPIFLFGAFTATFLHIILSIYLLYGSGVLSDFDKLILAILQDWQFALRYFILGLLSITGMHFLKQEDYLKSILAFILSILIFLIPVTGYCWMCQ